MSMISPRNDDSGYARQPAARVVAWAKVVAFIFLAVLVLVLFDRAVFSMWLAATLLAAIVACAAFAHVRTTSAGLGSREVQFRAFSDASPLGIVAFDATGDCTYTNPAFQRLTGVAEQELFGSGWRRAGPPPG